MRKLSFVIPMYNSENSINEVINQIIIAVKNLDENFAYEIILINDNSKDDTYKICKKIANSNENIKLINFSKNFGQHKGIICGYTFCQGDYIITLDDDLQNPPSEISKLLNYITSSDMDVVYGKRESQGQKEIRNIGTTINNLMANKLINKPKNLKLSSFFIMKKYIAKEMIKYDGPYPYIPGLILRITDKVGNVKIKHRKRIYGESNYNFFKLLSLWLDGFTNFSIKPLRVSSIMGFALSCISMMYIALLIIKKVLTPNIQIGWTSVMAAIVFFGGIQLISIGLIGEYIGRIFLSINNTPQYVIKETVNVEIKEVEEKSFV